MWGQGKLIQVAKRLDMGRRWLLSWMRRGVVSLLNFADNNDIR